LRGVKRRRREVVFMARKLRAAPRAEYVL
jgi:hypothetical protein